MRCASCESGKLKGRLHILSPNGAREKALIARETLAGRVPAGPLDEARVFAARLLG